MLKNNESACKDRYRELINAMDMVGFTDEVSDMAACAMLCMNTLTMMKNMLYQ